MSLLFVFASGMGTLLIVLGSFAGFLVNLPKAGMWMVKDGLCSDEQESWIPLLFSLPDMVQAIDTLEKLGKLNVMSGICFTGMNRCRDFSVALGLAASALFRVTNLSAIGLRWASSRSGSKWGK